MKWFYFGRFVFVGTLLLYIFKKKYGEKMGLVSLLFAITINIFLNSQFYPVLTQYQGGLKKWLNILKKSTFNPKSIHAERL